MLVTGLLALQIEPLQARWDLIGFPPVLRLGTCVSAIPRAAVSFLTAMCSLHRGKERTERKRGRERTGGDRDGEKHPWLFTKHLLFYLRKAVRGLPSPPHLSLISDKALFKVLVVLTYSRLTLAFKKYQRRAARYQRGGRDGRGALYSEAEPLIYFSSEEAVSVATAPFSVSSVGGWREFTPGWWAQWVITFCNENDWEVARRAEQRRARSGESPVWERSKEE